MKPPIRIANCSAFLGDRLTATAEMRAREGRTAIYDVRVVRQTSKGDELVAEFRGHARTVEGSWV